MAGQNLEFTISASDQASKVVTSVQGKIENFGKDVGKSIAGVLGPMALVGFAVSKVTDYLAEMEKKAKEAFDWGAKLSDASDKLGVTVEQFQAIQTAAENTNNSVEEVGKAFKLAAKLIADARTGNKEAIETLDKLGISLTDLEKTKPEDILGMLAGAMATAKDPTEKMAIAMTVLGASAKDLQKVLEKGFDIQGAFLDTEGLSEADAAILKEADKRKRDKERREKIETAKKEARSEFLKTPEGETFKQEEFRKQRQEKRFSLNPFASETQKLSPEQIDAEIAKRRAKKLGEEEYTKTMRRTDPGSISKATEILELQKRRDAEKAAAAKAAEEAEKNKKKKEKEDEKEKAKKPPGAGKDLTEFPKALFSTAIAVSSMREIGGGMAGEVAISQEQYQQNQLELLRRAVAQLEIINDRNIGRVDFTKPEYRGIVPPNKFLA